MSRTLISPKDLTPGTKIARINRDIEIVPVEVGKVVPIKRKTGGQNSPEQVVAYKIYPQAWLDDSGPIASDASQRHLSPFVVTTRDKVEVLD